tara:strand:+ start:134 stop:376 length:243 start_codon:yes stop_codon:yes gene_type:complete
VSWKDKLPSAFSPNHQFGEGDGPSAHARDMLLEMQKSDVPFDELEMLIAKYLMVKGLTKQDVDAQVGRAQELRKTLTDND